MDVHKKVDIEQDKKEEILGRYLSLKNNLGLNFFKPEFEGVKLEKEDTALLIQDQKRKLIYDREEISVLKMQN